MGDRRPAFSFRFWSAAAPSPRRTVEAQTTAKPPPTTPQPTAETKTAAQPTPTSTTPPTDKESTTSTPTAPQPTAQTKTTAETKTAAQPTPTSTTPPTDKESTTSTPTAPPPTAETKTTGQSTPTPTPTATTPPSTTTISTPSTPIAPPKTETQMDNQQANSTSARPTNEPQTTLPSRVTSQTKSSSPSRSTVQSRSPPQARPTPSSPSRMGSQTPSTPPKTPQLRSPSRVDSRSPKQTSSPSTKGTSPIKESQKSTGDPTFAPNEKGPKPPLSQQEPPLEPQLKAEVNDSKGVKQNEMEVVPSKLSEQSTTTDLVQEADTHIPVQKLGSSTANAENNPQTESKSKLQETKEVKEIAQATNIEGNEQSKEKANDFLTPKSVSEAQTIEKAQIPSKQALDTKEILPTPLHDRKRTNDKTSQLKKRSMISDTREESVLPKGEHLSMNKDIRSDISTFINRVTNGDAKNAIYDRPLSVITLAGENRGASMQMGSNYSKREGSVHIHRGYKRNPDESAEVTNDGEGSSKGKNSEDGNGTEDQPKEACVNNNAQGINNSIVFKSSLSERDPGVHMVINHVPKELIETTYKSRTTQTRKAEFNTTPADKHTYDPKVRRRCLRGLFLEPSDSDPENPEKPRRHGCLVGCKEKGNENNIDVL